MIPHHPPTTQSIQNATHTTPPHQQNESPSSPQKRKLQATDTLESPQKNQTTSPLAHIDDNIEFSTPVKPTCPTTESYISFFTAMHRPDLIDITFFLDNTIGSRFSISGSSAMMIHAHRLGLQEALHRPPNDLDIRIMPEAKPMLEVALLENQHQLAAEIKTSTLNQMKNDAQSHYFTLIAKQDLYPELKVDVLSHPRFGLMENPIFFHAIPLMPLAALITAKEASLQVLKEEKSGLEQECALYQENVKNIATTEQDIAFLAELLLKEKETIQNNPQQTNTENPTTPPPPKKRPKGYGNINIPPLRI